MYHVVVSRLAAVKCECIERGGYDGWHAGERMDGWRIGRAAGVQQPLMERA